jgi:hypothetical protein
MSGRIKPWRTSARLWNDEARDFVPVEIDVTIDWDKIASILARKASRNASGRTGIFAGAIKAKIVRKERAAS